MTHQFSGPDADPRRRAWLACPNCDHGTGCPVCQSSRNCDAHWQYLLENRGTRVFLQCPGCFCVWMVDTSEDDRQTPAVLKPGPDDAIIATVPIDNCPRDIAPSIQGDVVYVLTADSVKAVSNFHHIVASVPVGPEPKEMLMSADGSRIFVTSYSGSLSIIDVATMTGRTMIKRPSTAAVVSPDGDYIYLSHNETGGNGTRMWISTVRADGASVALKAIDDCITAMALSPDGRRLYVASAGAGSDARGMVTVIDTSNHQTIDRIVVHEAPDTVAVDVEGLLYITHYHANSVSVIDSATHCAITMAVGDSPLNIVQWPQSVAIYAANLNSVTAIDIVTGATTRLDVGELPRRLHVSADGRRLYVTDLAHGTIWVVNTSDNSVLAAVDAAVHPAAVALGPGGDLLYVTDSRNGTLTVIATTLIKPHSK